MELKGKKWYIIKILVILVMIIPICLTDLYILPAADDMSFAWHAKYLLGQYHNSYFVSGIVHAVKGYQGIWGGAGGYFFAFFLATYLEPITRWGIWGGRILCIVCNLAFYGALYVFTGIVLKKMAGVKEKAFVLSVYILLLFCVTNIFFCNQTSLWSNIGLCYVLVFALGLYGASAFICALNGGGKRYMILAMVLGFLAGGGILNYAALHCFIYMLVGAYGIWVKKDRKRSLLGFGAAFVGGMINLLSPGNYIRHAAISSEYNFVKALFRACVSVFERLYSLFSKSLLPWIVALLLILFLANEMKVKVYKKIHPIALGIVFYAVLVVLAFPVHLGYNSPSLGGRNLWVEDMGICFLLFLWTAYLAAWIKEGAVKIKLQKEVRVFFVLALLVSFCMWHSGKKVEAYPTLNMMKYILNGNNQAFAEYWEKIFDEIEFSDEKNLVVYREEFDLPTMMMTPDIKNESTNWFNQMLALYYDKSSVQLEKIASDHAAP